MIKSTISVTSVIQGGSPSRVMSEVKLHIPLQHSCVTNILIYFLSVIAAQHSALHLKVTSLLFCNAVVGAEREIHALQLSGTQMQWSTIEAKISRKKFVGIVGM